MTSWYHRRAAVRLLQAEGQSAVPELLLGLEDESEDVREAAVRAISEIATSGNAEVLEAFCRGLKDRAPSVRKACLEGLGILADCTQDLVRLLLSHVDDIFEDLEVRVAGVASVSQLLRKAASLRAMESAAPSVYKCFEGEASLILAALSALPCLAAFDPAGALQAIEKAFSCKVAGVRAAAASALPSIVPSRDPAALKALGALLQDETSPDARVAAVQAAAQVSDGEEKLLAQICEMAEGDPAFSVRAAAIEALSSWSSASALRSLVHCLTADHGLVRKAASEVLQRRPSGELLKALRPLLADERQEVRHAALEVVEAHRTDEACAEVCHLLLDVNEDIRYDALQSLQRLASLAGLAGVIQHLVALPVDNLKDQDRVSARLQQIKAIEAIAKDSGEPEAVATLAELTVDLAAAVRLAALGALKAVARRGNEVAIDATAALLSCDDVATQEQALATFRVISKRLSAEAMTAAARQSTADAQEDRILALLAVASAVQFREAHALLPPQVLAQLQLTAAEDGSAEVRQLAATILQALEAGEDLQIAENGRLSSPLLAGGGPLTAH